MARKTRNPHDTILKDILEMRGDEMFGMKAKQAKSYAASPISPAMNGETPEAASADPLADLMLTPEERAAKKKKKKRDDLFGEADEPMPISATN